MSWISLRIIQESNLLPFCIHSGPYQVFLVNRDRVRFSGYGRWFCLSAYWGHLPHPFTYKMRLCFCIWWTTPSFRMELHASLEKVVILCVHTAQSLSDWLLLRSYIARSWFVQKRFYWVSPARCSTFSLHRDLPFTYNISLFHIYNLPPFIPHLTKGEFSADLLKFIRVYFLTR